MKDHTKNVGWTPAGHTNATCERCEYQVPQGLAATIARALASLGRSRDDCILRNPYCAFELRRRRAQYAQYVRRMASPGAVARVIAGLPDEL